MMSSRRGNRHEREMRKADSHRLPGGLLLRQRVNDANDEGATQIYVPSKLDSPCTTSGRLRVWYAEAIIREMEDYDAKR